MYNGSEPLSACAQLAQNLIAQRLSVAGPSGSADIKRQQEVKPFTAPPSNTVEATAASSDAAEVKSEDLAGRTEARQVSPGHQALSALLQELSNNDFNTSLEDSTNDPEHSSTTDNQHANSANAQTATTTPPTNSNPSESSASQLQPAALAAPAAEPAADAPISMAHLSAKQQCNILLQSTIPYVEAVMGLPIIEVFQEQVDKAIIHDYSWAVNSADERWLSLIRAKLVHAQYENADHLARDVDKIRRCAEAYHGKRASKFRNPVVPANARALQSAFTVASHNVRPAVDNVLKGRGLSAIPLLESAMKDEPFGEEAFRNHRSDESSEIYYRKMRHAQRIFAKKLLQDPKQHAISAPPLVSCPSTLAPPPRSDATPSQPSANKGVKRSRDEIGCSDNHIGENSFGHLCKLMRTNYDTSDRELLEIRAELVHCDNRPDKHAFFLQLANGIRHRSVRQLELDWAQRKAAKREIQQGRASGDGLGDVATAAAASSGTAQLSALQSLFPRLPQLPLLPQNQPKAQAKSRHKAATKTAVQTQTQALLHRQASAQAQPETQLLHLNQSQPQQSFRDLKHNVRQDERHQQHPQQRRPQQDLGHVTEANTMLAHRRENGAVPDPTSTNAKAASSDSSKKSSGELLSGACNGSKPFAKQGEAPRSPKAADHRSRDAAQQEEERQDVVLSEDVKQQIKFHHGALKAIFDQQLELKLAELGWTSLEAKLRKHSSDIKVKEEQVARNSKIADLLRQSHHLDESEQAFLDETLWRMELAETSLGTLRREQQEMQAEMAHANLHVMDCQDKLSQSICLSNLQY